MGMGKWGNEMKDQKRILQPVAVSIKKDESFLRRWETARAGHIKEILFAAP